MRKLLIVLLLAVGITGLVACGSDNNADDASSAMRLAGGDGGNGGNGGDAGVGGDAYLGATENLGQWVGSFCDAVTPQIVDLIDLFEAVADGANVGTEQELNTIVALLSTISNQISTLGPPPITNGQALYDEYPPALNKAIATIEQFAAQNDLDSSDFFESFSVDLEVSPAAQAGWDALESEMAAGLPECASVQSLL